MNERKGWVPVYRDLLDQPIWQNSTPEQRSVLMALLLMANHAPNQWEWQGQMFKVQPGQIITSLEGIRKKSGKGVSIQNVRSALARAKKLEFLTYESTKTGRLITILNFGTYQLPKNDIQQSTQQTPNKGPTTNNNDNNDNKEYMAIFHHWNRAELITHQKMSSKDREAINKALNDFSEDQIKRAISNYAFVLKSSDHYFTHEWTLQEFLSRGLIKFIDEADPVNHYRSSPGKIYLNRQETVQESAIVSIRDGIPCPDNIPLGKNGQRSAEEAIKEIRYLIKFKEWDPKKSTYYLSFNRDKMVDNPIRDQILSTHPCPNDNRQRIIWYDTFEKEYNRLLKVARKGDASAQKDCC